MSDTLAYLLHDTARLMRRRFDERARQVGMTSAQWRTVAAVNHHPGINQGTLADLLEVEPITLCRMIDRLEESQMVERRRDPNDRRAWQIFVTDKAAGLMDRVRVFAEEMMANALAGFDEERRAALHESLGMTRATLSTRSEHEESRHG